MWFQDEIFRAGVFKCLLSNRRAAEEQPLFHLQVTFAALQAGQAKAFNPVDQVRVLRLDEGEQQDAQEFAKLFMDMLDREFKKQHQDEALRKLVSTQFEGGITYGTKCKNCQTRREHQDTFKEIDLTLNAKVCEDRSTQLSHLS